MKHYVTLKQLRNTKICGIKVEGMSDTSYQKLIEYLPKTHTWDDPIDILDILKCNGLDEVVWILSSIINPIGVLSELMYDLINSVSSLFTNFYPGSNLLEDMFSNKGSQLRYKKLETLLGIHAKQKESPEPTCIKLVVNAAIAVFDGILWDAYNNVVWADSWSVMKGESLRPLRWKDSEDSFKETVLKPIFIKHFS